MVDGELSVCAFARAAPATGSWPIGARSEWKSTGFCRVRVAARAHWASDGRAGLSLPTSPCVSAPAFTWRLQLDCAHAVASSFSGVLPELVSVWFAGLISLVTTFFLWRSMSRYQNHTVTFEALPPECAC